MSKRQRTHTPKQKNIKTIDDLTTWLNRRATRHKKLFLRGRKENKQNFFSDVFGQYYYGHPGRKR